MDEQQRCCGGHRDRCICPAERKTARRHDPHVSLAEVEQQRCPRRPAACTDPDPAPSASARGLTGTAPAVREASADDLDAAPRRSPRGIVRSAAIGRALCHEWDRRLARSDDRNVRKGVANSAAGRQPHCRSGGHLAWSLEVPALRGLRRRVPGAVTPKPAGRRGDRIPRSGRPGGTGAGDPYGDDAEGRNRSRLAAHDVGSKPPNGVAEDSIAAEIYAAPDESRNSGDAVALCCFSRLRKSWHDDVRFRDGRQSCASRTVGGCRRKREKRLLAACLWMLSQEPDVDAARVPEATGAPIRRHRRRDRHRLDGVGDQPSPSR